MHLILNRVSFCCCYLPLVVVSRIILCNGLVHHRYSIVLGLSVSSDTDLPDDERERDRETTPVAGSERSELASIMDRCRSISAASPEFLAVVRRSSTPPTLAREVGELPTWLANSERSELASKVGDRKITLATGVGELPTWLASVNLLSPALLANSERSELASGVGELPTWLAGLNPVRSW